MKLQRFRFPLSLTEVLGRKDPAHFLEGLGQLANPPGPGRPLLSERPELIRMIVTLDFFHTEIRAAGMWRFLIADDAPVDVPAVQNWCQRIGAKQAASYLAAAVAWFPRDKFPESKARREAWVSRMDRSSPDPLAQLDRQYKSAVDEMVDCLRTYIRDHAEEFEHALAEPVPIVLVDESAEMDHALAQLQKIGEQITAERRERAQKAKKRREELGITKLLRTSEDDPRMVQFLNEIAVMTSAQWVIVADRWIAHLRAIKRAVATISGIGFGVSSGQLYPAQETKKRKASHERAIIKAKEIIAVLRTPYETGTEKAELREVVKWAVAQALIIFNALDEIFVNKKEERAARTILSVFSGFITMPT